MTEFNPGDEFRMTEKGWAIAEDIWFRFVYEGGDFDSLAAEHDMSHDEAAILMAMAFQGGGIALGE